MSKLFADPQPYYNSIPEPQVLAFNLKIHQNNTIITLSRPPNTEVTIADDKIVIVMKKG